MTKKLLMMTALLMAVMAGKAQTALQRHTLKERLQRHTLEERTRPRCFWNIVITI